MRLEIRSSHYSFLLEKKEMHIHDKKGKVLLLSIKVLEVELRAMCCARVDNHFKRAGIGRVAIIRSRASSRDSRLHEGGVPSPTF
jgi:hypothetical protein